MSLTEIDDYAGPTGVVGRTRETELLRAALDSGAHVVLEGPPGTGKSTLLRAVAASTGRPFHFVEGNADLTPSRLTGHFDPAQVLSRGYLPDVYVDGPLLAALRAGALLYLEELNRVPEETLNVLLTVMSEAELTVPRLGTIRAEPGFRLVAAMNPFDAVGTARISSAVYDRTCRIAMGYQSAPDEERITALRSVVVDDAWRSKVVDLVRRTRDHRTSGSARRSVAPSTWSRSRRPWPGSVVRRPTTGGSGLDAALVALSGRIRLAESSRRDPESVVTELYTTVFGTESHGDSTHTEEGPPPGEA